jgi:opacity protein-like surface antigen
MVRYYFGSSEKGRPFAGVNGSFGMYFGNSKNVSSSGSSSETTYKPKGEWSVSATGGYEVFLTPNIGLYGTIGVTYGGSKTDYEYVPSSGTGYTYTSDYKSWSVPVSVGLQVHLAPRAK